MAVYAYIRVSTKEQHVERQIQALKVFNVPEKQVFCDWQSGKDFARPAWRRLIKRLRPGDLLLVKSIDRLGRNYNEILHQWQHITKSIGADIKVLDMELLDTRKREGDLTGTLIADLVLQILAYVAQTERDFIRQRQAEGIAAARARGVKFGREPKPLPEGFKEVCEAYRAGHFSVRAAAAKLGMSPARFYRRAKESMISS